MGGGLAGRWPTLKATVGSAIATHLQERFVANCSDLRGRHWCEAIPPSHNGSSYPRRRVSSTPRLIGSITAASGILDRPRTMTTECVSAISRRIAPEVLQIISPRRRGRRECRVLAAPAVSCAISAKSAHTSIQVQLEHSGIPCAMVLRLIPSSPWRRIPFASIAGGLKDCRNPVGSTFLRRLDTSNGCQNHTALPYAASPVVYALCSLTDFRPALPTPPRAQRCRVHRKPPQRS